MSEAYFDLSRNVLWDMEKAYRCPECKRHPVSTGIEGSVVIVSCALGHEQRIPRAEADEICRAHFSKKKSPSAPKGVRKGQRANDAPVVDEAGLEKEAT